jgi:hypothetical protein
MTGASSAAIKTRGLTTFFAPRSAEDREPSRRKRLSVPCLPQIAVAAPVPTPGATAQEAA